MCPIDRYCKEDVFSQTDVAFGRQMLQRVLKDEAVLCLRKAS